VSGVQAPLASRPAGPAGWYPDPWLPGAWRWFDGRGWTPATTGPAAPRKPRLPQWLSVPVVVALVPGVPALIALAVMSPLSLLLTVVPGLLLIPTLLWLDRVEPEPRAARLHAFLWGAVVATLVAVIPNSLVAVVLGEVAATVVSAPLVEEAAKIAGVLWAVRRHEVDGPMDGIVHAGWVAAGFALAEDAIYFATAADAGGAAALTGVLVLRGLLTPFAHPLFTMWAGLAIGRAVQRRGGLAGPVLRGGAIAVALHLLWNGSLAAASLGAPAAIVLPLLLFPLLFVATAVMLVRMRSRDARRLGELVPWMAQRYGLGIDEAAPFADFRGLLRTRRRLRGPQRMRFDATHAALARLAMLHDRPGGADAATEAMLVEQLVRARAGAA
jgi:protease PrsW